MTKVNCSFPWQNGFLNDPSSLPLIDCELEAKIPEFVCKQKHGDVPKRSLQ